MPVAAWPSGLPAFLREGYGVDLPQLNQKTDFALVTRDRPLYSDGRDSIAASAIFSDAQLYLFRGWYAHEIHHGADWFTVPILAGGVLVTREVKLTAEPRELLLGVRHWRMLLPLQTRTGTTMSREEWEAL